MDMRPRKKQKTIIEANDDERDEDWVPEDDEEDANQMHSLHHDNDKSLPDETEFDSTEGFQLKIIKSMKQSNHLIWSMFGHLMKNNKIVDRVKDRIYCNNCFASKKFKA